jgi:hypothetical protein
MQNRYPIFPRQLHRIGRHIPLAGYQLAVVISPGPPLLVVPNKRLLPQGLPVCGLDD